MTKPSVAAYGERQALPIDAFRQQLDSMLAGVNLNELTRMPPPEPGPEHQEAARIAAQLFAGKSGRFLLEYLADHSVRRPQGLPAESDPARGWAHVQRRAGQDDMFFFLLKLIAMGREEQPPAREGAGL